MSEDIINESKARIESLLAPINGGAGEDVSYDEKFEAIKVEIDKLSSLAGDSCNWGSVESMSEEILSEKSKDFRIGCYLACCKMRQGDLSKVLDGILLLGEMTARFWDDMYPPLRRIRARAGMIGWMSEQAADAVLAIKPKAADRALATAIDEESAKLDATFRDKYGEHYPGMAKLREGIRNVVRSIPKEAPKPPPAPEAKAVAPAAAAAPAAGAPMPPAMVMSAGGGGATAASLTTADEARRALEPTSRLMVKMGLLFRQERPENPLAYKLGRMGMWLELSQAPPVMDGKTLVPPPGAHIKTRLESLAASNDWLTLLNEADNLAGDFILWLDPHRFVSQAMSALGALFIKAKEELLLQVALLLKKVPTLPGLKFSDGSPYADAQTQMWLDGEVKPVLAAADSGGGGAPSALDEPLKEAKDHAMKGDLAKALLVMGAASDAAPTPAERFRGRLAVAQLCLGAGQLDIARGQLDGLTEVIRAHDLGRWDPRLCGEVYAALYSAHRGLNSATVTGPDGVARPTATPEARAAENAAFERLCQLDPAAALKLAPKK